MDVQYIYGVNGNGNSGGQLAKLGSPVKWSLKWST